MKNLCGCCEGLEQLTPIAISNRPGLDELIYRVGTHGAFFESMLAALSSSDYPALAQLTTRQRNDASIALLDAWATVADVLTFYQQRIANEGYLRTATERRSILELARLIGYQLRPGVSASVYLGFDMDKDAEGEIPVGTRAQSIPGPGELAQSFETYEALPAKEAWNALKPRLGRPQNITTSNVGSINDIYFAGTSTDLKLNDPLLFVFGNGINQQFVRYVSGVESQIDEQGRWERTRVSLQPLSAAVSGVSIRAAEVLKTVEKYQATDSFGVSRSTAMAKRVIGFMDEMKASITSDTSSREAADVLHKILPELREELAIAEEGHYDKLEPWVGGLVEELSAIESGSITTTGQPANATLSQLSASRRPGYYPANDTVLGTLVTNELIEPLSKTPSIQPANKQRLVRSIQQTFDRKSDIGPRLLGSLKTQLKPLLYGAIKAAPVSAIEPVKVYALRTSSPLFGHNSTKRTRINPNTNEIEIIGEWPVFELSRELKKTIRHEKSDVVQLEGEQNRILADSWLVVQTVHGRLTDTDTIFARARHPDSDSLGISATSRSDYGVSGKTTRIRLADPQNSADSVPWITKILDDANPTPVPDEDFEAIRRTVVYGESERLALAEEPILDETNDQAQTLAPIAGKEIELAQLYDGLEAGRWVIASGERYDAPGVQASELLMVSAIEQRFDPNLPGDYSHTVLKLAEAMNYQYKRESVILYGNVVKATHGETREHVLGSGDGSKAFQKFVLSFAPLTHVAANTPSGIESTLKVRVNDILWEEAVSLFGLDSNDRKYITRTDNEDKTTLQFGDGKRGLRLPTGVENVSAAYRSGIGKGGNVGAEQISLLASRPLGVKAVINPLPATGGANRDTRDQARRNAPFAIMALDRLVSVQDYADFTRNFAGIGKASATRLSDGHRQVVHVTIAGADDIPVSESSDLFRSLRSALHSYGDPYQPVVLKLRELILLIIQAKVRIKAEYQWEVVESTVRSKLLDYFSFDRRELGQDAWLSEVITVIENVAGVDYVDVDVFDGLAETESTETLIRDIERLVDPENPDSLLGSSQPRQRVDTEMARLPEAIHFYTRKTVPRKMEKSNFGQRRVAILPAQIAVLNPDIKDTLILTELT